MVATVANARPDRRRRGRPLAALAAAGAGFLALAACATSHDDAGDIVAAACAKHAAGSRDIGVVLLHDKRSGPDDIYFTPLTTAVADAGYPVAAPTLPWARKRIYDKSYIDAMVEINAAAKSLERGGARRIVVAGYRFGGNAAIGYAARHPNLAGVIVVAPAHAPERDAMFSRRVGPSVRAAQVMVDSGKGGERGVFLDANEDAWFRVKTRADVYLSYAGPRGPAVMPENARAIAAATAVLWVEAKGDVYAHFGPDYAYKRIPANPKNRFVDVTSDHLLAPVAARAVVIAWLNCL